MTSYNKIKKERDEAESEVYRLKRLIHGFYYNKEVHEDGLIIALEVQTLDSIEKLIWNGDKT